MDTLPQTMFSRWALERFEKRSAKSALIDISSVASLCAWKKVAVYGAAKAFNSFLTLGLYSSQLFSGKYQNVDFLSVCPGPVRTKLQQGSHFGKQVDSAGRNFLMATVQQCVEGSLRNLGKVPKVYGAKKHDLVFILIEAATAIIPERYLQY